MAKVSEIEPVETAEDLAAQKEGDAYAKAHAREFCHEHADELVGVIATYGDGDAEDVLLRLRELFWARIWKPTSE